MTPKYTMMVPLKLVARQSAPNSPVDGEVYYNTNDHNVWVFTNGVWAVLRGGVSEVEIATDLPDDDETTELWVDTDDTESGSSIATGMYLPLTGGELSGTLNIKLDDGDDAIVVETGFITVEDQSGGVVIPPTTVSTPNNHAVTKGYVDSLFGAGAGGVTDTTWTIVSSTDPGNPGGLSNPIPGRNSPLWVDTSGDGGASIPGSSGDTTWNFIGSDTPGDPTEKDNPFDGKNMPLWIDTSVEYESGGVVGGGDGRYGEHLVTRSGDEWKYRGAVITERPDVPVYTDGARVVWDTSLDPNFKTPPELAAVGDVWLPHGNVDPFP